MQDSNPHAPSSKAHVPRSRQQAKGNHSQLSPRSHLALTKHLPSARRPVQGVGCLAGTKQTELTCSVPSPDPLLPAWEEAKTQFVRGSTRHRQGIQTKDRQHQAVTTRGVPCTGSLLGGGGGEVEPRALLGKLFIQGTAQSQANSSRQSGVKERSLSLKSENPVST